MSINQTVCISIRSKAQEKLSKHQKGFLGRIKNRCVITGKSRGIIRQFGVSQTTLRHLARSGSIYGMSKSSWLSKTFVVKW